MMTPKQELLAHMQERHAGHMAMRSVGSRPTYKELGRLHANWHYRFYTDHSHAGPNLGVGMRPSSWYTGRDVVEHGTRR